MRSQHESIELIKEIGRKNQRRLQELEFAVHKLTRCMTMVDKFDSKINQIASKIELISEETTSKLDQACLMFEIRMP